MLVRGRFADYVDKYFYSLNTKHYDKILSYNYGRTVFPQFDQGNTVDPLATGGTYLC